MTRLGSTWHPCGRFAASMKDGLAPNIPFGARQQMMTPPESTRHPGQQRAQPVDNTTGLAGNLVTNAAAQKVADHATSLANVM